MFDLMIKGGSLVGLEGLTPGTIAVKNGKIAALSQAELNFTAAEVIDASGRLIFPGMIDCHVHLNEPGFEWREDCLHGTRSAAAGGITTIIDMPLQNAPSPVTAENFIAKTKRLSNKSYVDFALWGGLIDNNLEHLHDLYSQGAASLKVFLGPVSPDYSTLNIGLLRSAFQQTAQTGIRIGVHCEDISVIKYEENKAREDGRNKIVDYLNSRPVAAEILAVANVIELVRETKAKAHICHVSHPAVAEIIKKAKAEGLDLTAETCSHYLIFNEEVFQERGPLFKCAPPLRSIEEMNQLWTYVLDGTLDCLASDHSPCAPNEKEKGLNDIWQAWTGISGLQTTFQIMFEEIYHKRKLNPSLLAELLSSNPAKAFGLYPRKGTLRPGSDADLVIVNPETAWEVKSSNLFYKNPNSAFVGTQGKGAVEKTIIRGKVVFDQGIFKVDEGYGEFVNPRMI